MEKKYRGLSNIDILKKYVAGERPFIQTGYVAPTIKRNVGDVWTDSNNKTWKKISTDAIVSVNEQADIIRDAISKQCPTCKMVIKWGTRRDEKLFNRTGLCENCLIEYETKLRILGIYDSYEAYKMLSYELGFLKEARGKVKDVIKYFSENSGDVEMLCNSEGFTERWKCTNKDDIIKDARNDLKLARRKIAAVSKAKEAAKAKYVEGAKKFNLEIYVR